MLHKNDLKPGNVLIHCHSTRILLILKIHKIIGDKFYYTSLNCTKTNRCYTIDYDISWFHNWNVISC